MPLSFAVLLAALAQTPAPPVYRGAYLAALDEAEHERGTEPEPMLLDLFGLVQSFVGMEEETLATFDAMDGTKYVPVSASPLDDAVPLDAIPTDQFVATGPTALPYFLLSRGEYRLLVQDAGGKSVAAIEGVRAD